MKGKTGNIEALMKAMRKVTFPAARGPYKYNVNGFPIQNFYKAEWQVSDELPAVRAARFLGAATSAVSRPLPDAILHPLAGP